jgi:hypothetical protein
LSKRIEESSNKKSEIFGIIPYIDPKKFTDSYSSNEKSDVYSIGVLLWEISSGHAPFSDVQYDVGLAVKISAGQRETMVPDTPEGYFKIYNGK